MPGTEASLLTCRYCGAYHGALCPMVKAYEYHPTGELKRVEFFTRYELDSMAIKAYPAVPVGTGTGSAKLICARCGREGHLSLVCPDTIADNRRAPSYLRSDDEAD